MYHLVAASALVPLKCEITGMSSLQLWNDIPVSDSTEEDTILCNHLHIAKFGPLLYSNEDDMASGCSWIVLQWKFPVAQLHAF